MARKSKFFRVATEGATTDGRKIERKWLQQAAKNFDPLTYGARVFMEHIRGINPAWGFSCLGDVLALETREVDGKLALFAQIDPTDELVTLTHARQKIYSSIEIAENFANTGEAYLVGLGVTDSPASLGTEILAFASQNPAASPFTARKQAPENVFSAAEETVIEIEDEPAVPGPSLFARIKELLTGKATTDDARFNDVHSAVEHVAQAATETADALVAMRIDFAALQAAVDANKATSEKAVADLINKIDHTPSHQPARPAATGGRGVVATDC